MTSATTVSRRLLSRMRLTSACESLFQPAHLLFQLALLTPLPLKQRVRVLIHTFEHPCLSLLELLRALLDGRFTVRIGQSGNGGETANIVMPRPLSARLSAQPAGRLRAGAGPETSLLLA